MPTPRKYSEPMVTTALRMTPEQKELFSAAGTADFWRPAIDRVSTLKLLLDDGQLTTAQFEQQVGEQLAEIAAQFNTRQFDAREFDVTIPGGKENDQT